MVEKRRTQAERRAETYRQVMNSAIRLFGERGYAATSLEDIATDCKVTTRPIYHYFGNKKGLFAAVNEVVEARIIDAIDTQKGVSVDGGVSTNWLAFMTLCDDPGFRRIVLVDGPNILGRERWSSSAVSEKAKGLFSHKKRNELAGRYRSELFTRMVMGAFTEAALMVAEAEDVSLAKEQAEKLVAELFTSVSD